MQTIHPSIHHGGTMERPGNRPQPAPTAGTITTPTGSTPITDEITLSAEAKSFIETTGPGKSGGSTAHRALMAESVAGSDVAGMSFGKIVSSLARGIKLNIAPAAVPVDDGGVAPLGGVEPVDPVDLVDPALTASLANATDPAAPGTDETTAPVAPVVTEDTIPVVDAEMDIPDLFPGIEPVVDPDPEAGLLELLDAAIDEADDENLDGLGGIDIAA